MTALVLLVLGFSPPEEAPAIDLSQKSAASEGPATPTPPAPTTHCQDYEEVVYSCRLDTGKTVSLCGAGSDFKDHRRGHMQYRYGKIGRVELAYPSPYIAVEQAFRAERYTRPMPMATTELRLSFEREGWTYTVFHNSHCEASSESWNSEDPPAEPNCGESGGLLLSNDQEDKELMLSCTPAPGFPSALFDLVFKLSL